MIKNCRAWTKRSVKPNLEAQTSSKKKVETRKTFLAQKFGLKWYEKTFRKKHTKDMKLPLEDNNWLKSTLFSPTSKMARQAACNLIDGFCLNGGRERKREIIDLLTSYLDHMTLAGESAQDFSSLYEKLISSDENEWKFYLSTKGVLQKIADLIINEIKELDRLERTSLGSDLAQGFTLKTLTDLLSTFISVPRIKSFYKGRMVSTVLHGYLSLRKLVVQRTKLIDSTQEKLLELLEDMTTGTLEETKNFMAVCVDTIKRYPDDDQLTPVFIFERLCNIIFPEETDDAGEFLLSLEKDPQQEDFLQGRMLGNPYSSTDPDLGPLMREIKNKICRDCELVALLEDDNGMELLVNNKIISLDLPVKDVYQKIWVPAVSQVSGANDGEPMRVVYRMRGLLGDATEEFIETLQDKKDNESEDDDEVVYKLANVMADCGGLEVMLQRMDSIKDANKSKSLLSVLLKLFGHCIKVSGSLLMQLELP